MSRPSSAKFPTLRREAFHPACLAVEGCLVCLAWAFWNVYGPASRCRTDGSCAEPRQLHRRRRWLWVATLLIAALLLFPYYIGWFL